MAQASGPRALILGGADTLRADMDAALALFTPDLVIACNHAGRDHEGPVTDWVTMHPDIRERLWIPARARAGLLPAGQLWHARHRGLWKGSKPVESWGGSSGMLCVAVGFELGCSRMVLCGVPMEKRAAHYNDPRPWSEARQYHNVWTRRAPQLQGIVKSMSGWTRDLLGEPTKGWIDGDAS